MRKIREIKKIINGNTLSETKGIFSASSKRFINQHKQDIEILIYDTDNVRVFYGESDGLFIKENDSWIHDYGNLYKSKIITKIVNELMVKEGDLI